MLKTPNVLKAPFKVAPVVVIDVAASVETIGGLPNVKNKGEPTAIAFELVTPVANAVPAKEVYTPLDVVAL